MNYQKEDLKNNQIKFTYEADKQDWLDAIEQAYHKTKGKFNIPGFRKGKAPKKHIEAMYGTGVFFEDALDIIVPKYYQETLDKETEVFPVSYPDYDIIAISDCELKFAATVTVKPEVKLGQYKNLTFKKIDASVSDEEVNAEIDKALEKAGSWEEITDRAAQKGDMTVIDFSGSVDGVKFDGGTAEKQQLELGSGMFIPGFEEQVEGMKIGESKDITVKFPEDYGESTLAGKDAVFAVVLHEIKAKSIPALDDEFVKDVSGDENINTVEAYKNDIKARLLKNKQDKANIDMENEMVDEIAKNCEVDIPDVMVENQIEDMIQEFEYRLMYQGMKPEDYYKYTQSSREELRVRYMESAKKSVLTKLVMEALIKAEKFEVSEAELDAKLTNFAEGAKKSLEEYKKSTTSQQISYLKNEIITDKLLDFLKSNNKFA